MNNILHKPIADTAVRSLQSLIGKAVFFSSTAAKNYPLDLYLDDLLVFPADASAEYIQLAPSLDYIEDPWTPFTIIQSTALAKPDGETASTLFLTQPSAEELEFTAASNASKPGSCEIRLNPIDKISQIHLLEFSSHSETSHRSDAQKIDGVRYEGGLIFEMFAPWSLKVWCVEGDRNGFAAEFLRTSSLYGIMKSLGRYRSLGAPQDRSMINHD